MLTCCWPAASSLCFEKIFSSYTKKEYPKSVPNSILLFFQILSITTSAMLSSVEKESISKRVAYCKS